MEHLDAVPEKRPHLDAYAGPEPNYLINEILLRRGGKTPSNHAIYRMVRSEYIFEKVGGLWHDWDDNLDMSDRGGMDTSSEGIVTASTHRPERIVAEVREVPTYSHFEMHGWVIERWFSADYFGSPQLWNGFTVKGTNLPALGPYPELGRYLLLVGPFPEEPDTSFMFDFIAHKEQERENYPRDIEAYVRQQVLKAVKRDEQRAEKAIAENHRSVMNGISPLLSNTLEAGRWRTKMWEKSGHTTHLGS